MAATSEPTILVLGGSGKTGRRVAERLAANGRAVRAVSRRSDPPFDWNDTATWAPVLRGVGSAYVAYAPDLAVPGAVETVRAFTELALDLGVRRVVLLSGRGEEEAERAERAVRATVEEARGEWTVVRCAWFAQNFSEDYLLEPVLAGEVILPVRETPEPFVDADDIADVAVTALTEDGHQGELYELTGPRLLTFAEAVGEIGAAAGRSIRFVPVTVDDYTAAAAEQGVPGEVVELLAYLFGEVLDGRNARLADGVQRALGREPRDFRDYARSTAAAGVWSAAG